MSKGRALRDYLVETLFLDLNKLVFEETDITLHVCAKDLGLNGVRIAYKEYTAEFDYQGLTDGREDYFLPAVAIWINENDSDRKEHLGQPTALSRVYPDSSDVALDVKFLEEIQLVPDDKGMLPFNGQRYRVGDAEVHIAESFELAVRIKSPDQNPDAE